MMSHEDYVETPDEQKKVFSDLFERQTLTAQEMRELLGKKFNPQDKVEFFRLRKEQR
jgi:hypothetical protein